MRFELLNVFAMQCCFVFGLSVGSAPQALVEARKIIVKGAVDIAHGSI